MLLRAFRDGSIATKLNVIQATAVLILFAVAIAAVSRALSANLEQQGIEEIRQSNQQAIGMVETVRLSLEQAAERLCSMLQSSHEGEFVLREDETVEVGGAKTPLLSLNGRTLNNSLATLDRFTVTTTAVGTIFARQGNDFVRIATSLKKEDGSRAMGTLLNAKHPALGLLLSGKPYTGKASLFGRDYMTSYKPLRDRTGNVVGAVFVGLDFSEQLADMKRRLSSASLFQTGYIFIVDASANKGELVSHPSSLGENLWDAQDGNGVYYIREIIEKKDGLLYYQHPKIGETRQSEKIAVFNSLPSWNWVLVSSVYTEEFEAKAKDLRNRLAMTAVVLCALLCSVVFFSSKRWVSRPLSKVGAAMKRIAAGDLTVTIGRHGNDEVGQLLDATDTMVKDMRATLVDIKTATFQLAESAGNLSGAAMQVATQSGQQSEAASTMAANIEEMSTNIVNVAENANHANDVSEASGQVSSEGAEVIGRAVASMARIAETVHAASKAVTTLGQESKAISAIVNVIREIADQTNLLALNAAIEAARAGEQGRGFAVVADEVGKLAERTSASTQEIGALIDRILHGTEDAVARMGDGVHQVEEGMLFAERAASSISSISGSAAQVTVAVTDISRALEEQAAAISDITKNVERIAGMADDNNGMAKKSAEYAGELERLAESLRARMAHFTI
ncbi:MAG: methyl-accepting chemotaxis protein [Azoarcus sp.]|jgi:methyl-accepting chemotaxis protein|nr:methyl-accepting chemotaxis protein [Azoarcus sp.]